MKSRREKKEILIACACGMLISAVVYFDKLQRRLKGSESSAAKYMDYFQLLNHWMEAKNNNICTSEYFAKQGYRNIAIYGMGELANRLCEELEDTDINIQYGIDREVCGTISRMDRIYSVDDRLENVDAVVVTPFYAFDDIYRILYAKMSCPIISIEEVVWSL